MYRSDMIVFTVGINLPVWRESKLAPRVAEAIAMHDQALDMYQAQENEVYSQLRQQVASAEQSLKSARLYETGILPQARLTVESSLAAYKVNRVDFLTLLDNQMTVFNYEIGYATASFELQQGAGGDRSDRWQAGAEMRAEGLKFLPKIAGAK